MSKFTGLSIALLLTLTFLSADSVALDDKQLRTRHLLSDGSPRFTNRLSEESSPYLKQHAHNPVEWYPWGDEAFRIAKEQGKPVLLSIGYSTCHWCHVMERESFENLEIAAYLNEHYIAIKVDREERPDLDRVYMAAVEAFSGSGGWPMTVWLTPERKPFYASTYLPPFDGDRGVQTGFVSRLKSMRDAWDNNKGRVFDISDQLSAAVRSRLVPAAGTELPDEEIFVRAFESYASAFDTENGGLKSIPKFASHLPIRFLLRHHRRTGDQEPVMMAEMTLDSMARGGIFDQVGGGFHRYSTDASWSIPHFEKMLYDNALLVISYLEAYQLTGNESFARVVRDTLLYADRDMRSPGGAFYAASDADGVSESGENIEGVFFTWTLEELEAALDRSDLSAASAYFGVAEIGLFGGRNVLRVAKTFGTDDLKDEDLSRIKRQLYKARQLRPAPFVDKKILTAWNGLMISAFARASLYLGDRSYLTTAAEAAEFVLGNLRNEGRLMRAFLDGSASGAAFADDYAYMIQALIDLYQASGDIGWFQNALQLQAVMLEDFGDDESGGFFFSPAGNEFALAREKPVYDSTLPSANSVAVLNLLRLHELTSNDSYRVQAQAAIRYLAAAVTRSPAAAPDLLQAVDFFLDDAKTIVIVTAGDRSEAEPFLRTLGATFLPNHVLAVVQQGDSLNQHAKFLPIVEGKRAMNGHATAYVCIHGICDLPTSDVGVFAKQIGVRAE